MSDITMCEGKGCDLKSTCYRYKADPGYRQSYFIDSPIEDGQCDYYEELKDWKDILYEKTKNENTNL